MISHRPTNQTHSRYGFSLVEMMVVMVVIGLLIGISVPVIGMAMTNARIAATRATITKMNGLIQERRQAFDRTELPEVRIRAVFTTTPYDTTVSSSNKDLARLIARKVAYRGLLPQVEDDLYGLDATSGNADDAPLYAKMNSIKTASAFGSNDADGVVEPIELLYLALTEGSVLGAPVGTEEFSTSEARDTDDDGFLEFVDAWGKPLHFYRWPTRLIRPAEEGDEATAQVASSGSYPHKIRPDFGHNTKATSVGATAGYLMSGLQNPPAGYTRSDSTTIVNELNDPLATDPDDPLGLFANWLNAGGAASITEKGWHTPATYHAPLVMSFGPDNLSGLQGELDFDNYGHLAQPNWDEVGFMMDNITNAQQSGAN